MNNTKITKFNIYKQCQVIFVVFCMYHDTNGATTSHVKFVTTYVNFNKCKTTVTNNITQV